MINWNTLEWLQCLTSLVILAGIAAVIRWDRKEEKRKECERTAAESKAHDGAPYEYLPFDESEDQNAT